MSSCRDVFFCRVFGKFLSLGIPSGEDSESSYLNLFSVLIKCLEIFVVSFIIISIIHSRRLTVFITDLCSRSWVVLLT